MTDYSALLVDIRAELRNISEYASRGEFDRAFQALGEIPSKCVAAQQAILAADKRRQELEGKRA